MEIPDARQDDRFFDNPLVKKKENPVIFYAGIPVLDDNGLPLGTLCVIDNVPRRLSQNKRKALRNLGKQVEELIKLHRLNEELQASRRHLVKHNTLLEAFAGNVSHDMKMPLANLIITSDILSKKYNELLDGAGKKYLKYLKTSSLALSDYINSILEYYKSTSYELEDRTKFDLNDLLENIIELINIKHHCTILLPEVNRDLFCNRVALEQIFLNLIGNGIKYNDKPETIVKIEDWEDETHYWFSIEDNGQGIPAEKIDYIFDLFSIVAEADRDGKRGHGIGLSTVKQLTLSLGGDISVISKLGHMSKFTFSIAK
jgi:signal transduction histidine kinase